MQTGFIEITTAVEATQLSEKTLERFISAGYIKSTTDENNRTLIDAADVKKTFGVEIDTPEKKEAKSEAKQDSNDTASPPKATIEKEPQSQEKKIPEDLPEDMLERVVALQGKLLDEKDAAIKSQVKEIEWLRTRIEKLESQGEKDKVLLLSSNQTINELIKIHHPKRGIFHRALSWVMPDEDSDS